MHFPKFWAKGESGSASAGAGPTSVPPTRRPRPMRAPPSSSRSSRAAGVPIATAIRIGRCARRSSRPSRGWRSRATRTARSCSTPTGRCSSTSTSTTIRRRSRARSIGCAASRRSTGSARDLPHGGRVARARHDRDVRSEGAGDRPAAAVGRMRPAVHPAVPGAGIVSCAAHAEAVAARDAAAERAVAVRGRGRRGAVRRVARRLRAEEPRHLGVPARRARRAAGGGCRGRAGDLAARRALRRHTAASPDVRYQTTCACSLNTSLSGMVSSGTWPGRRRDLVAVPVVRVHEEQLAPRVEREA